MSKHTFTPWIFDDGDSAIYTDIGGVHIATVTTPDDLPCADLDESGIEMLGKECAANGYVMAAAPELLAEVKISLEREYNPFEPDNQSARYHRLKALVDKAEKP